MSAATALAATQVVGANDRIRVGLIGSGGRGTYIAFLAKEHINSAITAVADVYPGRIEVFNDRMTRGQVRVSPKSYQDYRALLDDKDVDAVIIGTPDHWHVPMTIDAVQAGKDVYVEKPLTHNIAEGQAVIDAVERSDRIVQVGYQQRSYPHMAQAKELIAAGRIGKVTQVLTWWNQPYLGTEKVSQISLPDEVWKEFLGTACPRAFDPRRYWTWRWFWDYGGGTLTDLYSHWIDAVHWILDDSVPVTTQALGYRKALTWLEAPDTVTLSANYPTGFQVSYNSTMVTRIEDGGMLFRGTDGSLRLLRPLMEIYPENGEYDSLTRIPKPTLRVENDRDGTIDHVINWGECIRSRKQPNAPVRSSVDAANAAHYGNIAMRSGRTVETAQQPGPWRPLFDGQTLNGWTQDTPNVWSVRDGMIVGKHTGLKWNDFLRTNQEFGDFELELEFRLVQGRGNSGVQFRSVPAPQEHELTGYQADIGEGYWGCLYDESRRNRVLVQAPREAVAKLDPDGWHRYRIRAYGRHIQQTLDGMHMVDYVEEDTGILDRGIIALQAHSGPGVEIWFRNIRVRTL
jgi:predicted dehydrogenase